MSQIVIEIPLEALGRPGVASALAELVMAVGGHAVEPPLRVAVPVVFTDVRLVPAAPVANTDLEADDPREVAFFVLVDRLGELYARYYRALKVAGLNGLSVAQARKILPELDDQLPRALAGITGYASRWCEPRLGFKSPVEKTQDGQRWIGWPKA